MVGRRGIGIKDEKAARVGKNTIILRTGVEH